MKKELRLTLIVIIAFSVWYFIDKSFFAPVYRFFTVYSVMPEIAYFLAYLIMGLPMFAAVLWLRPGKFFSAFGMNKGFGKAVLAAVIFTLPMLLGYAVIYDFNSGITFSKILRGAVFAALFEEWYFRGFVFGMLFRFTRLGFIPSILLGAFVFAVSHLYQSSDPGIMAGIFMTTLLGAGLFAWVYSEWKFNLWVAIWLHLLMNLYWMLFDAGDNALGPLASNIFRASTIAFIIIGTLLYKKRSGLALAVNKKTIWMKDERHAAIGL
ncbi:MAG: CPBP family intramembrane metalloprotease [Bacteroidales bacterium]|nr:CPBP family intramembrane metalloprotease [Bacteroidales bacterium]MDP2238125.1 CPBP family intramembrane metalloprotease [Bacteroidales bacterium]